MVRLQNVNCDGSAIGISNPSSRLKLRLLEHALPERLCIHGFVEDDDGPGHYSMRKEVESYRPSNSSPAIALQDKHVCEFLCIVQGFRRFNQSETGDHTVPAQKVGAPSRVGPVL